MNRQAQSPLLVSPLHIPLALPVSCSRGIVKCDSVFHLKKLLEIVVCIHIVTVVFLSHWAVILNFQFRVNDYWKVMYSSRGRKLISRDSSSTKNLN